jgi:aldose 1-epimerase
MSNGITTERYGSNNRLYTLTYGNLKAQVTDYGATLVSLYAPDREGQLANVVLGFPSLDGYLGEHPYFGAIVGPCANRIGNASFTLDGAQYKLEPNNGPHLLHGGAGAFSRKTWHAQRLPRDGEPCLQLTVETHDGDGGFPGSLMVTATYTLRENELLIEYEAFAFDPTVCSLTSHPYWNLKGAGNGTILEHVLQIFADCFTPADDSLIPTGEILGVHGTGLDFTNGRLIQHNMFATGSVPGGGYDVNFVLRGGVNGALVQAAILRERTSGRQLEIWTTKPGLQLYTGNGLDGTLSGTEGPFIKHGGVCLEAQFYPDALNHLNFPNVVLRPGSSYKHATSHRFSVVN